MPCASPRLGAQLVKQGRAGDLSGAAGVTGELESTVEQVRGRLQARVEAAADRA
ncbi:MAG: hypothetical protein ABI742_05265 [Gemmatimonadota bacterium]